MNWKRILTFVVWLYVLTFAIGFATGFANALLAPRLGRPIVLIIGFVQVMSVIGATVLTFFVLARVQEDAPYAHAAAVALLVLASSFVLNVLVAGLPVQTWAGSLILFVIGIAIGTPSGIALRRRLDRGGPALA